MNHSLTHSMTHRQIMSHLNTGSESVKVKMEVQHWISVAIPISGYLTSVANISIFLYLNKGRNPLSYVMIKSE